MLITFSGLDGSGKSTLISHLIGHLISRGYKVKSVTMYYDMSVSAYIRKMRDSIKNIFSSGKSVHVKVLDLKNSDSVECEWDGKTIDPKIIVDDKQGFFQKVTYKVFRSQFIKRVFLFLDLLIVVSYRLFYEKIKGCILITDRYIYDSLADVINVSDGSMSFVNLFLRFVPKTDIPILIEVSAEIAFARKREYPISYMKWRRAAYHTIFKSMDGIILIKNENLETSKRDIESMVFQKIEGR